MNRRSYKGVDDYGSVINVGDGYYNDAYEDEESKNIMTLNNNRANLLKIRCLVHQNYSIDVYYVFNQ